jgi:coenzyme F420 hydrogenase subunit beta
MSNLSTNFLNGAMADELLGQYERCYSGHALDDETRFNSASGGLATALLISALETGWIDGALVVGPSQEYPLRPQSFIARTREEIVQASGSRYCPVPVNVALDEILRVEGRYAVVGLPCHVHGIRKAQIASPTLRSRIALCIGLFCGCMPSFLATEFLLETLHIDKKQVTRLDYRGRGWPGQMTLETRDGLRKVLPYPEYWGVFLSYFFPYRCLLCTDVVAEVADLSLGDAWLTRFKDETRGMSIIVSRNAKAEEALFESARAGAIDLARLPSGDVVRSQASAYAVKRSCFTARTQISKIVGKKVPSYGRSSPDASLSDYIRFSLFLVPMAMARKRVRWSLFRGYLWLLQQGSRLKRSVFSGY